MKTISLPDGTAIPALGQGAWMMGDDRRRRPNEIAALRTGVELGMTLIDAAEMYGDGAAEELIQEALGDVRDELFIVSKAYPQNASRARLKKACEASLSRLGTDRLDLYLLHWRGGVPLAETVEAMERLVDAGKILRWGVSNLDMDDMKELIAAGGGACATDQIFYNLTRRGSNSTSYPGSTGARSPSWPTVRSNKEDCYDMTRYVPSQRKRGRRQRRSRSHGCCDVRPSSQSRKRETFNTSTTIDRLWNSSSTIMRSTALRRPSLPRRAAARLKCSSFARAHSCN